MKESIWGLFVIVLGIIGLAVVSAFQSITTTNENDYYLLKEVTEAAMYDSLDLGYYRRTGEFKILEELFVENFTRRFSESFGRNRNYTVGIYDIIETPPKVSIAVYVGENVQIYNFDEVNFNITNTIDGVLETKY